MINQLDSRLMLCRKRAGFSAQRAAAAVRIEMMSCRDGATDSTRTTLRCSILQPHIHRQHCVAQFCRRTYIDNVVLQACIHQRCAAQSCRQTGRRRWSIQRAHHRIDQRRHSFFNNVVQLNHANRLVDTLDQYKEHNFHELLESHPTV